MLIRTFVATLKSFEEMFRNSVQKNKRAERRGKKTSHIHKLLVVAVGPSFKSPTDGAHLILTSHSRPEMSDPPHQVGSQIKPPEEEPDQSEQKSRAVLRRDFLRALGRLCGRDCRIRLHSGFLSGGKFLAFDRDVLHFCVEGLHTPTGEVIPQARLRATDVDSVTFAREGIIFEQGGGRECDQKD